MEDAKVALALAGDPQKHSSLSKKIIPKSVRKRATKKHSTSNEMGGLYDDPQTVGENGISALDVLEKWDTKHRDETLRLMPSFRPCPHCSEGDTDGGVSGSSHPWAIFSKQQSCAYHI